MNQRTELNSELLSADARGRKHIPFAVFAVILIHVVLFVVLLVAAGCRSSARAKATRPDLEPTRQTNPADNYLHASTNAQPAAPLASVVERVVATEPVVDDTSPLSAPVATPVIAASPVRVPVKKAQPEPGTKAPRFVTQKQAAKAPSVPEQAVYVVQSGDTVEKIAKRHGTSIEAIKAANKLKGHTIFPGQRLVVKPAAAAGSTAQVKKARSSNEV